LENIKLKIKEKYQPVQRTQQEANKAKMPAVIAIDKSTSVEMCQARR